MLDTGVIYIGEPDSVPNSSLRVESQVKSLVGSSPINDPRCQSGQECQAPNFHPVCRLAGGGTQLAVSQILFDKPVDAPRQPMPGCLADG